MSYLYEQETQQAPRSGLLLLQCLVLGTFFVFALRFWYLQIHRSEEFAEQARENQLREEPIYSTRGQIMDRNGRVLAVNEPGYALTLVREDCKDLDATLAQVSVWTDIELDKLKKKFDKGKRNVKPFQRQTLVSDISFDLVSKIEANTVFWPGLEIQVKPRRLYPQGPLVSHLLGYVAEVSEEDLARNSELSSQDIVGKQGLELLLDNQLRGLKGRRQFEVDAAGRRLSSETLRQPVAGEDVVMSIDVDLQAFIYNHLEGEAGGVVVLDPFTGQVLALVTQPSYDNNAFTVGLTGSQWQALQNHPRHPLQNRVIQSVYPPGSVWKLVVAASGLQERFITPGTSVFCSGAYTLGTREFRCWKKDGHGSVNLKEALIHSCDVYFYQLGERLGVDRMSRFAHACGFGEPTGIDLPHEKGGLVPTRAWKRKRFNDSWHGGENLLRCSTAASSSSPTCWPMPRPRSRETCTSTRSTEN